MHATTRQRIVKPESAKESAAALGARKQLHVIGGADKGEHPCTRQNVNPTQWIAEDENAGNVGQPDDEEPKAAASLILPGSSLIRV